MKLPLASASHGMLVIEENVASVFAAGLRFAVWLLDGIDPTQRLTYSALAVTLSGGDTIVWRTQREQDASPNSYSMGFGTRERRPVHRLPAHRPHAARWLGIGSPAVEIFSVVVTQAQWPACPVPVHPAAANK